MRENETPIHQGLYMCHSRNAILRCIAWKGEFFKFEWVFCMSRWAHNQRSVDEPEMIHKNNLYTLFAVNEMEALAYASR